MSIVSTSPEKSGVLENRELSWLAFNERVLGEADNAAVPLMERLRFAAIFGSNLDEFFMVRTGALIDRRLGNDEMRDPRTCMRPSEQLSRIYAEVRRLNERRDVYLSRIENELSGQGIRRSAFHDLTAEQSECACKLFEENTAPHVGTVFSRSGELPPFVAGKRICAACRLSDGSAAFLCLDENTERLLCLPCNNGETFVLAEEVMLANAEKILGQAVTERVLIRLTRSAAISLDDAPTDELPLLDAMKQTVNLRDALPAVRMQLSGNVSGLFAAELCSIFSVDEEQMFVEHSPLDLSYTFGLAERLSQRSELFFPPFAPSRKRAVSIDEVLGGDVLLSYPYEDLGLFLGLLEECAEDGRVVSLKITLYRTARDSHIVQALCNAAHNRKDVTVCIELRARFDERHNIACAEKLAAAGCKVLYGGRGIKVHSKLCLITLRSGEDLMHITQIGTGNYNEVTARQYTDHSLITRDEEIAADAERVFSALVRGEFPENIYTLMVSPTSLKSRIFALIDEEIAAADSGAAAYFGAKLNGLSDTEFIAKLIEASRRGVKIDLIVRGICCLRPGVSGLTDNIRVISIVGRFLEHSRIYIFGRGSRQRVFISSADFMPRNIRRRIEAAAPVRDPALKKQLSDYFAAQLADTTGAYVKRADGCYSRVTAEERVSCQERFLAEFAPVEEENRLDLGEEFSPPEPSVKLEKPASIAAPVHSEPLAEEENRLDPREEFSPTEPSVKLEKPAPTAAPVQPEPLVEEENRLDPREEFSPLETLVPVQTAAELPPAPADDKPKRKGLFARIAEFFGRFKK